MELSIYKTPEAKIEIMKLYEQKLASCSIRTSCLYVDTFAGKTHVTIMGDKSKPPIVVLHGVNAGGPFALEAVQNLKNKYAIYAIDTIGQTTKSAETKLSLKGDAYAQWLLETMDKIGLEKASIIGISYGAFLLQKLMVYQPQKITKAIFIVPSGLVNIGRAKLIQKLAYPLAKFFLTKKDKYLFKFMDNFYQKKGKSDIAFQKNILLGVKMSYRRPPLLKAKEVQNLDIPVYAIVAENDIFFPSEKTIKKCNEIFKGFKDYYILKNSKHIPNKSTYPEIEKKIEKWLMED